DAADERLGLPHRAAAPSGARPDPGGVFLRRSRRPVRRRLPPRGQSPGEADRPGAALRHLAAVCGMKGSQCQECERLRARLEQVREALADAREALLTMCGAEQIPALMSEIDAALAAAGGGDE